MGHDLYFTSNPSKAQYSTLLKVSPPSHVTLRERLSFQFTKTEVLSVHLDTGLFCVRIGNATTSSSLKWRYAFTKQSVHVKG